MQCHDLEECLENTACGIRPSPDQHGKNVHRQLIVDRLVVLQLCHRVSSLFSMLLNAVGLPQEVFSQNNLAHRH